MGVYSDGTHYGIPEGLIYSFPVICVNNEWQIIDGLKISDYNQKLINITTKELEEEKRVAGL